MKNLKRVLSLMMAVLLCFGLFPGSALAAENDYDGYLAMIEYKDRRYSLSENLPAPFGGRTTEEFFELRINDLRTYRTAYCIQMGVRANSGIGYEASDDYASFTEEQKALINTTLTLGYNMETGTKYGGSAIDEYIATQILIWLIAHNQLGTGYESQIVDEITANSPAAKPIFYTLRENVMNYRTIPSFTTDDPSAVGAYTHALQYNESTGKNETTLVDENNVLGDFTFSCPGVDFSVDGNQLHVSTSETDFGTITAEKSLPSSIPGVITGSTKYWLRDTYQNVVTFDVEGEAQPVKCYFSLEIRSGTLQIVKTSEDGEVSGIPFHISGNGVERDVVTGPDGTIGVDNLQAGTYTITEQSPDRYVQPASQQVTIYPGQTASVSFSNVLKKFTVTMEKVDSVTGEAQGDASLDGAVYGMFKGETLLDTYTTSGGGKFITKEYPCGPDYSIREISPSEGYLLDETVYPVGAEPGNFTLEHNSVPMTATEDVVLGSIAITKHTDQPAIPEQDAPAPETEPPTEEEAAVTEEQQTESAEETPAPSTPENGAVPENKVTATAIKATIAAVKGLIAAIAAGGWVAVVIILLICLIALIVGSCFGLFFGSESTGTGTSVTQAVADLNGEYQAHIQEIEAANPHDRQEITSNDGVLSVNWEDVLAVFSAKVTGAEDGSQVASLDDAQVDELRSIMWEMNAISYTTRTESSSVEVTSTDENGNEVTSTETVTETILEITITHKSPEEMAQQYSFNDRQNEYLALMTEPENENLWAELLGGYVSGGGQIIDPHTNWEGTGIFQWPLPQSYTITSWFGYRADPFTGEIDYHSGTDIGAPGGTPILAAADGTVTIANGIDSWGGGYGYYIKVRHNDTYETLYAHCSSICVVAGQEVKQGEVIGYVGTTGNSTGNHLHFEVWQNGRRTDALSFFRAKG